MKHAILAALAAARTFTPVRNVRPLNLVRQSEDRHVL